MAQFEHRDGCSIGLRRIQSGHSDWGRDFIPRYGIQINFPIECMGCCLDYLVAQRNYQRTPAGIADRVYFSVQDPNDPREKVSCFVRKSMSPNGVYGQIATDPDPARGIIGPAVVGSNSHKYQLYGPTEGLCMGTDVVARIESIALDFVEREELTHIYVNYADAVLMEMYRAQRVVPSLRGICTVVERPNPQVDERPNPEVDGGLDAARLDMEQLKLK